MKTLECFNQQRDDFLELAIEALHVGVQRYKHVVPDCSDSDALCADLAASNHPSASVVLAEGVFGGTSIQAKKYKQICLRH